MPTSFLRPRALGPGSRVRVIAPSSPFDGGDLERGIERLRARYEVSVSPEIGARCGFLAGDDARRRRELEDAIDDPDVDAILAARGGYGAMRILSGIDPARVAARPRLLIGFSDVTAVHALWARAGVCSIHGIMGAALGRAEPAAVERWIATVEGAPPEPIEGLEVLAAGTGARSAEGPLLGGNLALLAAMVGTPLFPPLDGAILFLEDNAEAPYRIDRMLTQLTLAGALDRVAGVLAGTFTRCEPGPDGTLARDVLAERLGPLGVPILWGVHAGHVEGALDLPLGATIRLDPTRGTATFADAATS